MRSSSAKKKGSQGPTNKVYYEEQRVTDEIIVLNLRLAALKRMYLERMEKTAEKKKHQLELGSSLERLEEKLCEKSSERVDVLTDYTRQYKVSEREAIMKIALLDASIHRLNEEKSKLLKQIEESEVLYDKKIKEKRLQCEAICERGAEMEKEFTTMINDIRQTVGLS